MPWRTVSIMVWIGGVEGCGHLEREGREDFAKGAKETRKNFECLLSRPSRILRVLRVPAPLSSLDSEIGLRDLLAGQRVGSACERDAPLLQAIDALRHALGHGHVLLDDRHRHAL